MAPKDEGIRKPNQIRYLNQFDMEINLLFRIIISKKTMNNAGQSGSLTESQWGGQTGKDSISVALSKELTIHFAHAYRRNIFITDFDVIACFDRLVTSTLFLSYHKYYPFAQTLHFLAKALLQHEYSPITGFGTSPLKNSHPSENPHVGPNQGSTDESPGCVPVSNTLIKVYETGVNGIKFLCPRNITEWTDKVLQFIDDTNTYHDGELSNPIKRLTQDIQRWMDVLYFIGGAVKSTSHINYLIFSFTPEGRQYVGRINDSYIQVQDPLTKTVRKLPFHSPETTTRYLGTWRNMLIHERGQKEQLLKKIR